MKRLGLGVIDTISSSHPHLPLFADGSLRAGQGQGHRRHQRRRTDWSPSRDFGAQMRHRAAVSPPTAASAVNHEEDWVFLSANATRVVAHTGSTAVLDCVVRKDSQFGMVRRCSKLCSTVTSLK